MTTYDKSNIGLTHDHDSIGKLVTDAEFRGYMISQGQERQRQIEEVKDELHELKVGIETGNKELRAIAAAQAQRITTLELDKARQNGFVAGIGVLAGVVSSIIIAGAMKLLGL